MPEPFWVSKPLVAVLHAAPLPGSPRYGGQIQPILAAVLRDAEVLAEAGMDGLLLENFGDAPFFPGRVPAVTVAAMTALACEVRRRFDLPLGINVLRNDGQSALAIAAAAGAQFVRVNVLCGARVTDQGVIAGIAHDLLRDRAALGLARIRIFADVDVKHSAPMARRPIEEEADETLRRGGADGLLVTGTATGRAPEPGEVLAVRMAAQGSPVLVASGLTPENLGGYARCADGFVVGTWLKRDGVTTNPVDPARARALVEALLPHRQTAVKDEGSA